nr:putative zinc finger, CCHC-type [Tanacetum cinerariifolium]
EILTVVSEVDDIRQDCVPVSETSLDPGRPFLPWKVNVNLIAAKWICVYPCAKQWQGRSDGSDKETKCSTWDADNWAVAGYASVRSTSAPELVRHDNGLVEIKFSSSQPRSVNVFPTGIHIITLTVQEPAQEVKHIWRDVCNYESCLDEAVKIDDDDEDILRKRKSSQQKLKRRYEKGDPTVGFLEEPLGKFDYYVLYPKAEPIQPPSPSQPPSPHKPPPTITPPPPLKVTDVKEKDKIKVKTGQNQAQNGKRGKVNQVKAKVKVKPIKTGHEFGKSAKNRS